MKTTTDTWYGVTMADDRATHYPPAMPCGSDGENFENYRIMTNGHVAAQLSMSVSNLPRRQQEALRRMMREIAAM